eukprot:5376688-Heterocapsa_arctica.AAC.1
MGVTGPLPGDWRHEGTPRPGGLAAFGICTNHSQCSGNLNLPHQHSQPEEPGNLPVNLDQGNQDSD